MLITFSKVQNDGYCKVVSIYKAGKFLANLTSINEHGEWTYYCSDTNKELGRASNTDFASLTEAKQEIKIASELYEANEQAKNALERRGAFNFFRNHA